VSNDPTHLQRRRLLQSAAWLAVGGQVTMDVLAAAPTQNQTTGKAVNKVTDKVAGKPPGKPGDFDFLAGNWNISHRRKKTESNNEWDEFKGEATCWTILGGVGSVEELRIPARGFSGMGLRMLDVEKRVWSDFWVNAKSGVLTTPGTTGYFENGAGIFISEDTDGGKPIQIRGLWDQITPKSCRWSQASSRDGGKTWDDNWIMHWVRA
jgi:hypothetical protein